jgi:hypothetical protein
MVLIIALLIPLFRNLMKQSINNSAGLSTGAIIPTNARAQRTAAELELEPEPAYSSYNFYLLYLAIPDLILNLYLLIMYGSYSNQNKFNSNFHGTIMTIEGDGSTFENAFIVSCSTANLVRNMMLL